MKEKEKKIEREREIKRGAGKRDLVQLKRKKNNEKNISSKINKNKNDENKKKR